MFCTSLLTGHGPQNVEKIVLCMYQELKEFYRHVAKIQKGVWRLLPILWPQKSEMKIKAAYDMHARIEKFRFPWCIHFHGFWSVCGHTLLPNCCLPADEISHVSLPVDRTSCNFFITGEVNLVNTSARLVSDEMCMIRLNVPLCHASRRIPMAVLARGSLVVEYEVTA